MHMCCHAGLYGEAGWAAGAAPVEGTATGPPEISASAGWTLSQKAILFGVVITAIVAYLRTKKIERAVGHEKSLA